MYNGGGCGDPHTESEDVSDHTTGSENVGSGGSGEVIQDETEDFNNGHVNGQEGDVSGCNGRNVRHDSGGGGGGARSVVSTSSQVIQDEFPPPAVIKQIPIGDPNVRSPLRFEVVTARVVDVAGKKHVAYTITMKRVCGGSKGGSGGQLTCEPHPAVIERRYSDFCFIYECILKSFHPSVLGDFLFPKKVLIGNFKAEVISERTDAFHKFLNLIANCDNLLYSEYFYSFLSSEEHNEAVSHIKLGRYAEATPLLQSIFYVREKLLSVASIHVLLVACELVACLAACSLSSDGGRVSGGPETRKKQEEAMAFAQVAMQSFELVAASKNHEEIMVAEPLRIPFLKLALQLATELGQPRKAYERELSELRYSGVRLENAKSLLEVVRDRYIHRPSHTSKIS